MTRRALPALVLGCLAALLASLLMTATPAAAETVRGTDPRGDVQRFTRDGQLVRTGLANGDVVGYRVSYNRQRLEMALRYRALNFRRPIHTAIALVRTGPRQGASIDVETGPQDRAGTAMVEGLPRTCRVRHRISYRDNLIVMRVPSRCFGAPPVVSVQLGTSSIGGPRGFESVALDTAPGDAVLSFELLRVRRG